MGLLDKKKVVVLGLLDKWSIAHAIGQAAAREGAEVFYSTLNRRVTSSLIASGMNDLNILECDVQDNEQISRLFKEIGPLDGLVYSVAYANRKTCLGEGPLWSAPREDVIKAISISALSFAYVAGEAAKRMNGGSMLALTFESQLVMPRYKWMGVAKNALEGITRDLALELGDDGIRVNALSSGPLKTTAAMSIPGNELIGEVWNSRSALPWNPETMHDNVANSAIYLLSHLSEGVTGTVHHVDGGFHIAAAKEPK